MSSPTTASCDLLGRARAGDAEAFCELCRIYEGRLLRQAAALCGDAALAEDLAQDTLVQAWKCIRSYNGRCQFFTWICAILLHRARNLRRRKRPVPISSLESQEQDGARKMLQNLTDPGSLPDEAAQLNERTALLMDCLRKLPAKHREIVYLRFYVDDSLEGIAAAVGCSVGTVKSRLFHALEKLRSMSCLNTELRGFGKTEIKNETVCQI